MLPTMPSAKSTPPPPSQVRVGMALKYRDVKASEAVAVAALRVRAKVFCSALSASTGVRAVARVYDDYSGLIDAVCDGRLELAWLPPLMAVQAIDRHAAVPLLIPVRGGSAMFWSALICRHDSTIRGLEDLQGRRIAWVEPQSASGHTVMRAWLQAQGVDVDKTFKRAGFVGSHDAVVGTVLGGKADVGATYAHVSGKKVVSGAWRDAPVRVIGLAGPIPSDVLAASAELSRGTIRVLRDALVGDVDSELRAAALALFEADRFEVATNELLNPLRALSARARP
jgi:phosphonate transport system substrate-binding protein